MDKIKETSTVLMEPGFHYERNRELYANSDPFAIQERIDAVWGRPPKEGFRESLKGFLKSLVEIWVESGKAWEARQAERQQAKQTSKTQIP
jgi:hypothetical protein